MFLFIGGPEVFVILLLVVMLFGADKIPEIARGLAKGISQVKNATNDIKREISNSATTKGLDLDIAKDVKDAVEDVKSTVDDITGPIKRMK